MADDSIGPARPKRAAPSVRTTGPQQSVLAGYFSWVSPFIQRADVDRLMKSLVPDAPADADRLPSHLTNYFASFRNSGLFQQLRPATLIPLRRASTASAADGLGASSSAAAPPKTPPRKGAAGKAGKGKAAKSPAPAPAPPTVWRVGGPFPGWRAGRSCPDLEAIVESLYESPPPDTIPPTDAEYDAWAVATYASLKKLVDDAEDTDDGTVPSEVTEVLFAQNHKVAATCRRQIQYFLRVACEAITPITRSAWITRTQPTGFRPYPIGTDTLLRQPPAAAKDRIGYEYFCKLTECWIELCTARSHRVFHDFLPFPSMSSLPCPPMTSFTSLPLAPFHVVASMSSLPMLPVVSVCVYFVASRRLARFNGYPPHIDPCRQLL